MRIIRMVCVVWLVVIASVSGALLFERSYSAPNRLPTVGLDTCNSRMCFMGIIPGVTEPAQADTILQQHGAVVRKVPNSGARFFYTIDENVITFQATIHAVTYLTITTPRFKSLPVTLGDAIGYLGTPCKMERYAEGVWGFHIRLIYQDGAVDASNYDSLRVNLEAQLSSIELYPPTSSLTEQCKDSKPLNYSWKEIPWTNN